MKLEYRYQYTLNDPKRHKETLTINELLIFAFPKLSAEDRALKGGDTNPEYEKKKEEFFANAAKQSKADWTKKFKKDVDQQIKSEYDAKMKAMDRLTLNQEEWKQWFVRFGKQQVAKVKEIFAQRLTTIEQIVVKEMSKAEQKKGNHPNGYLEKTISHAEAAALFVEHYPLKYKVDDKFNGDHMIADLQRDTVEEAALERYKANQNITTSSWVHLTEKNVLNKVNNSKTIAMVYNGTQQLSTKVTAETSTVTLTAYTDKDFKQGKVPKDYHVFTRNGAKTYVTFKHGGKTKQEFRVNGEWNPLTGVAEVYHFEARAVPASHAMLPKYLKWLYDPKTKKYIGPMEKK